ncbi:MAG: hypothetical protein KF857_00820 [Fimbriimonadaceae bacterium]|nr:hypothetical protein [Fimbriimonadaceae bacterium]
MALSCLAAPGYFYRQGIPDYDQRRGVLPNDGNMYCVPTSYVDLARYMSDNGMSSMSGGYWDDYVGNDGLIFLFGYLMATSATDGTYSHPAYNAFFTWTSNHTSLLVIHTLYGPSFNWGKNTIRNRLLDGSLCRIGYGRYKLYGGSWHRDGGHSLALAGYDFRGSVDAFFLRDPATDDGDLYDQSDFHVETYETRNITLTTAGHGKRTLALCTLFTGENNDKRHVYDNMHCILPVFAGWFNTTAYNDSISPKPVPGKGQSRLPSFTSVSPWNFGDPTPRTLTFDPAEPVVDWCYDIGSLGVFYLTDTGKLFYCNLVTGEHYLVTYVPGGRKVVVAGPSLDVFVLTTTNNGDRLVRLERDDMTLEEGRLTRNVIRRQSVSLPGDAAAMDVDTSSRGVALMSKGLDKVWMYNEGLVPQGSTAVTPPPGDGEVVFRIDPARNEIVYARRGAHQFFAVSRSATHGPRMSPYAAHGIESIELTGDGKAMVQDGGVLRTFDAAGLEVVTQLTGLSVMGQAKLIRSHVAAEPETMVGQEWRDVFPQEGE